MRICGSSVAALLPLALFARAVGVVGDEHAVAVCAARTSGPGACTACDPCCSDLSRAECDECVSLGCDYTTVGGAGLLHEASELSHDEEDPSGRISHASCIGYGPESTRRCTEAFEARDGWGQEACIADEGTECMYIANNELRPPTCSGNTNATLDVHCAYPRELVADAATREGRSEQTCCQIVGLCRGNTDGSADVACEPPFSPLPSLTRGRDGASCCQIVGMCRGNTDGSADVACEPPFSPLPSLTRGRDNTTCCDAPSTVCTRRENATCSAECWDSCVWTFPHLPSLWAPCLDACMPPLLLTLVCISYVLRLCEACMGYVQKQFRCAARMFCRCCYGRSDGFTELPPQPPISSPIKLTEGGLVTVSVNHLRDGEKLGISLKEGPQSPTISSIAEGGVAARTLPQLRPGLTLYKVGNVDVEGLPFEESIDQISKARLPMPLTFRDPFQDRGLLVPAETEADAVTRRPLRLASGVVEEQEAGQNSQVEPYSLSRRSSVASSVDATRSDLQEHLVVMGMLRSKARERAAVLVENGYTSVEEFEALTDDELQQNGFKDGDLKKIATFRGRSPRQHSTSTSNVVMFDSVQWLRWEGDKRGWRPYEAQVAEKLEKGYKRGQDKVTFDKCSSDGLVTSELVDLSTMIHFPEEGVKVDQTVWVRNYKTVPWTRGEVEQLDTESNKPKVKARQGRVRFPSGVKWKALTAKKALTALILQNARDRRLNKAQIARIEAECEPMGSLALSTRARKLGCSQADIEVAMESPVKWKAPEINKPRMWKYVETKPPGFTCYELYHHGSSWDVAYENSRSAVHTIPTCFIKLLLWHLLQPVMYIYVFLTAYSTLDTMQQRLGSFVLLRESLYLLALLACVVANPAFLLVDVSASARDDPRFGVHVHSGYTFLARYVLAPEKYVVGALFGTVKICSRKVADCWDWSVSYLFDLCALGALTAGVATDGGLPLVLFVGYAASAVAAVSITGVLLADGVKRGQKKANRAVVNAVGFVVVVAMPLITNSLGVMIAVVCAGAVLLVWDWSAHRQSDNSGDDEDEEEEDYEESEDVANLLEVEVTEVEV